MGSKLTEVVSEENAFSTILCRADEEGVDCKNIKTKCNKLLANRLAFRGFNKQAYLRCINLVSIWSSDNTLAITALATQHKHSSPIGC